MRLSLCVIVCSLLVAPTAMADEADEATFADIATRLAAPAVIRGTFTQTRYLKYGEFSSGGRFVLSDLGLYWEQQEPVAAVMIADGERLLQSVGDNPLQSIDAQRNPMTLSFSRTFLGIFNGNEDDLRASFDVQFESSGDEWSARLEPLDELMSMAIEAINIRGREYIDELTVITRASDRMVIGFSDLQSEPGQLTDDEIQLYAR